MHHSGGDSFGITQDNGDFVKKLFLRHSALNVAAQSVSVIGPIFCSMFAGSAFGGDGLAITGFFSPLFFLAGFLGMVVAGGSTALASKLLARDEDIDALYTLALLLLMALSAMVCFALVIFKDAVIIFSVKDMTLIPNINKCYGYSIFYVFFTAILYIPLSWSRLVGRPGTGIVLTVVLSVVSILGALVTTYMLHMGVEGIILSQTVASFLAFFCASVFLHLHKNGLRFKYPKNIKKYCLQIFWTGSPLGLSRFYRFAVMFFINRMLLNVYGKPALEIYSVLNTLLRLVTSVTTGVSTTVIPIAGVFSEERDSTSCKQLMRNAFLYGNMMICFTALVMLVFGGQIADLFGIGGFTRSVFSPALLAFCVYIPFFFNINVFISYYTSIGKVTAANLLVASIDMLFPLLFVFLFAGILDISMVWTHLPLSGLASAIVLLCLLIYMKIKNKRLTVPLLLDRELEEDGKYISFSVDNDIKMASEASVKIYDFCESNALSPKETMLISMSIEEMLMIIINNASLNDKNDSVSIRIFIIKGSIILRIRNNGKKFNPITHYKENIHGDLEKDVEFAGIKYIVNTAKVVYYRETFGVNNLVIVI